jgi:hypothetical protein
MRAALPLIVATVSVLSACAVPSEAARDFVAAMSCGMSGEEVRKIARDHGFANFGCSATHCTAIERKEQGTFESNSVVNLWFDQHGHLMSLRLSHFVWPKGAASSEPIELCS